MMSVEEAVGRAKQFAQQQGWAWVEPSHATLQRAWFGNGGKWLVVSNAQGLGAKARVLLDAGTGEVLEHGYIPR